MQARIMLDGTAFDVRLERVDDGWEVEVDGHEVLATCDARGQGTTVRLGAAAHHVQRGADGEATIDGVPVAYRVLEVAGAAGLVDGVQQGQAQVRSPMAGTVERVAVAPGDEVAAGDVLFVLEAMKMRNEVRAPMAGRVKAVHAEEGRTVDASAVLVELDAGDG